MVDFATANDKWRPLYYRAPKYCVINALNRKAWTWNEATMYGVMSAGHVHLITCYFYRPTAEQKAYSPIYGLSFVACESSYTYTQIEFGYGKCISAYLLLSWGDRLWCGRWAPLKSSICHSQCWAVVRALIVRWRTISHQLLRRNLFRGPNNSQLIPRNTLARTRSVTFGSVAL